MDIGCDQGIQTLFIDFRWRGYSLIFMNNFALFTCHTCACLSVYSDMSYINLISIVSVFYTYEQKCCTVNGRLKTPQQSGEIEVSTSFFVWQKFFLTVIKICNIEIHNRLLWVRWYHGNSTFPPYWNAKMPSFAQYELGCPAKPVSIRNNKCWLFSIIRYFNIIL